MKIKVKTISYGQILKLKKRVYKHPKRPSFLFRKLIYFLSKKELKDCNIRFIEKDMENLGKKEPCLILMNHSCFLDLKIAYTYFRKRKFNTVATSDSFVGKEWLIRSIGCIPTDKFVPDVTLIKDIIYALKRNRSVLMYPEAGYSLDGTAIILPDSLGKLIKLLKVPVITLITNGAFLHDPLYNNLQQRKTNVKVNVTYKLSKQDILNKSVDELNDIIKKEFTFDAFKYQQENGVQIGEVFRAIGLHRVLYKCPHCKAENMSSTKLQLRCNECGATYTLGEYGDLQAENAKFTHIPDWYAWQRHEVKNELENGDYFMDIPVRIGVLADYKAIYFVGDGRLIHNKNGFELTGIDGLCYKQPSAFSYSLNVDYFWYEMGDVISIGNKDCLYYCFPKNDYPVTKARLAVEEMYKMLKVSK